MPLKFRALKPTRPILVTSKIERELAHELDGFVAAVEDAMSTYPPQRPGSSYRRTGTLMRSWSIVPARRQGGSLIASVGSNVAVAPYNEFVQGDAQPFWMANLGWRKVLDVADKLWPRYRARLVAIIRTAGGSSS